MFIRFIYRLSCIVYCYTVGLIQIFALSQDKKRSLKFLFKCRDIVISGKSNLDIHSMIDSSKCQKISDYLLKYDISEEEIFKAVQDIFTPALCKSLVKSTGFKYNVNFVVVYMTKSLPNELINENMYANIFHFDKPYSPFMAKIIVPAHPVSKKDGPLQIISNKKNLIEFTCNEPKYYIFFPRVSLHRDSSPSAGRIRHQLMMQLIPSKEFAISISCVKNSEKKEPKYPELKNWFKIRRFNAL